MKKQKSKGFTLVEVMIIVAIIGIIAAIAVPSYAQYIKKVNRKTAIAKMREIGQMLEHQYDTVNKGAYPTSYPATTSDGYKITATITEQSYIITASKGATGIFDDTCGTLTLNNDGETTPTGPSGSKCFK